MRWRLLRQEQRPRFQNLVSGYAVGLGDSPGLGHNLEGRLCQLACTGKCESEPQNLFDSENDFKDGLLALLPLRIAGRTESVPVKENTNMLLYEYTYILIH